MQLGVSGECCGQTNSNRWQQLTLLTNSGIAMERSLHLQIAHLTSLTSLDLGCSFCVSTDTPLSDRFWRLLVQHLTSLRSFTYRRARLLAQELDSIVMLPRLERLCCERVDVLKALVLATRLTALVVTGDSSWIGPGPAVAWHLQHLTALRHLEVATDTTGEGATAATVWSALAGSLESLTLQRPVLRHVSLRDRHLCVLSQLRNLRRLRLDGNYCLTSKGVEAALGNLRHLTDLSLAGCGSAGRDISATSFSAHPYLHIERV